MKNLVLTTILALIASIGFAQSNIPAASTQTDTAYVYGMKNGKYFLFKARDVANLFVGSGFVKYDVSNNVSFQKNIAIGSTVALPTTTVYNHIFMGTNGKSNVAGFGDGSLYFNSNVLHNGTWKMSATGYGSVIRFGGTGDIYFQTTPSQTIGTDAVLFTRATWPKEGGLSVSNGAFTAADGVINAFVGYRINNAALDSTVLGGNGANYIPRGGFWLYQKIAPYLTAGSWVGSATSGLDMNSFTISEARNITGSDLFLIATDSARLEGDNSFWELNTAFTRLNVAGTNVLAWNNTDRTFSQNIPDNTVAAYNLGSTDGNSFVQITTTNTAPRMILGSNESGAAIGLQGIQYEEVQAIVASGAFTATKSTITVDLASTGTVNADLTVWPTATTVASILTVINIDAAASVTVDVTGATWFGGVSPVLTPGASVNAKLINGVLYVQ